MGPSLLERGKRLLDSFSPNRPYLFTYWVVGALSVYILTGRFSSPNKRLRRLSLVTLSDEEASPPRAKQQGKSEAKLAKKLVSGASSQCVVVYHGSVPRLLLSMLKRKALLTAH
jgi:hypothetical protein